MKTSTAVPNPSMAAAPKGETKARAAWSVPNIAGLGKYSPKTMAES